MSTNTNLETLIKSLSETLRIKVNPTQFIDILSSSKTSGMNIDQITTILNSFESDKLSKSLPPHSPILFHAIWQSKSLKNIQNGSSLIRSHMSYLCYDGILFVYGGKVANKKFETLLGKVNLQTLEVEIKPEWQGPGKRKNCSLVLKNENLLLYGGSCGDKFLNDLWSFDLINEKWSEVKTKGVKPLGRDGALVWILEEKIFIYGGGNGKQVFSDCFWLDLESLVWSEGKVAAYEEYGKERRKMAFCAIGKNIFMFGGLIVSNLCTDSFDLITLNEDLKITVRKLSILPCARYGASLIEIKEKLLVLIGGSTVYHILHDIWVYSILNDQWMEIETANHFSSRIGHCCITYNDQLMIFGGWNKKHFSDSLLWSLHFSTSASHISSLQPSHYSISPNKVNIHYCVKLSHRPRPDRPKKMPESSQVDENQFAYTLKISPEAIVQQSSEYFDDFSAILQICRVWQSLSVSVQIKGSVLVLNNKICKVIPKNSFKRIFVTKRKELDKEFHIRQKLLNGWERAPAQELGILKITIKPLSLQVNLIYDILKSPCILFPFFKLSETVLIVSRIDEFFSVLLCRQVCNEIVAIYMIMNKSTQIVFPNESLTTACTRNILSHTHFKSLKEILETKLIDVFLYTRNLKKTEKDDIVNKDQKSLIKLMENASELNTFIHKFSCTTAKHIKEFVRNSFGFRVFKTSFTCFSMLIYYGERLVYWKYSENVEQCWIIEVTEPAFINPVTDLILLNKASEIQSFLLD